MWNRQAPPKSETEIKADKAWEILGIFGKAYGGRRGFDGFD